MEHKAKLQRKLTKTVVTFPMRYCSISTCNVPLQSNLFMGQPNLTYTLCIRYVHWKSDLWNSAQGKLFDTESTVCPQILGHGSLLVFHSQQKKMDHGAIHFWLLLTISSEMQCILLNDGVPYRKGSY